MPSVVPSNTVTTDEIIVTTRPGDANSPNEVYIFNTGSAVLYINFGAAATDQHVPIAAGGSIRYSFRGAVEIHGFCATSTTVVVTQSA